MKVILLLLLAPTLLVAADKRNVNGITVDLQPIHDWKQAPKGDRPMPHWKDVYLVEIQKPLFGGYLCNVRLDGKIQTVVIMHLPKKLLQLDEQKTKLSDQIAQMEKSIADQDAYRQDLRDNATRTLYQRGNAYENYSHQGDMAAIDLRKMKEDLASLKKQYGQTTTELDAMRDLLAMNAGREISGSEVWEHGQTF